MLRHARSPYDFLFLPTFLFVASGGGGGAVSVMRAHIRDRRGSGGVHAHDVKSVSRHTSEARPRPLPLHPPGGGEGTFGGKIGDVGVTMILEPLASSRFGLVPGSQPEELNTWQLTPAQGGGCQRMKAACSESFRTFSERLELKHVTPSPCTTIFFFSRLSALLP